MAVPQSDSTNSVPLNPIEATAGYRHRYPIAYEQSKLPFDTPRAIKIIAVGAGVSGLSLAHAVETGLLANVELKILEKNAGLGGTWFENRYPGCACDIPSHNYLFTWAPNPKWSSFYVSAPEILKYMEDVADRFDLRKYIHTSRKVIGSYWSESRQKWQIVSRKTDGRRTVVSSADIVEGEIGDEIVEECDVFINASGLMNHWRWPDLPGRENYKGVLAHSANYDPSVDLKGKKIAVIGNGSSGIQVTAAVQPLASELSVYIRSPTWITANLGSRFIGQGVPNIQYDEEQQKAWIENPEEYLNMRKEIEKELNFRFPLFVKGTQFQQIAREFTNKDMRAKLEKKPELAEKIIPSFSVGCRRPTPGSGYLNALCADNTQVVWGEIDSFTDKGLRSKDGTEREFDVIIAATGFDFSFKPRWPIVGANDVDLQETWGENPACYLSALAQDMPNYFIYMGPGCPVGHGSMITSIERITLYIVDLVRKLQTENYSSFRLRPGKAEAYQFHMLTWLQKTVWGEGCQSSFKNGLKDGALHAFHPGSRLQYFEMLRRHRYEDFDWKSRCDDSKLDFAWFNNGFLAHELATTSIDEPVDPTWYLDRDTESLSKFIGHPIH